MFRGHKADIFEGGHRVPCIVRWPAGVKAGSVSEQVICTTDLFRSFAIRKGDWKLIMCPGSGGWSLPRPGRDAEELAKLPEIQLYNLKDDPGETTNLQAQETAKVEELKALLSDYNSDGRSTPGQLQTNDSISSKWKQIDFTKML